MSNKLVIAVLGHPHSGKSTTWNDLFEARVKTGRHLHRLYLSEAEWVEVFLVSGSPQERNKDIADIIGEQTANLVLCSLQYREDVIQTIDYFLNMGYAMYVQWLNPGYNDGSVTSDSLKIVSYLLDHHATISIRNAKENTTLRVQELREHIYGWAWGHKLIQT